MTAKQESTLCLNEYRFTIKRDRFAEVQHTLAQAARAGQSPHPFQAAPTLAGMVLVVWGLSLFENRQDRALTRLHVPASTSLATFDTFLSLIAPSVAKDKPAYFDVTCQKEDGDQEFFYHFEEGKVIKEKRVMMYIPAELALVRARSDNQWKVSEQRDDEKKEC